METRLRLFISHAEEKKGPLALEIFLVAQLEVPGGFLTPIQTLGFADSFPFLKQEVDLHNSTTFAW